MQEGSVKMSVCSPVWLKSSSKAAMATTTCFISVIVLGCNKQSSSFKSFIYKSSSFESFIYRALALKLHLQSFTYKASVQGIQIQPSNNHHFGPYMDLI
ncbi:hypothetical protein ACFX12_046327 [Malus domestica]